MSKYDSYETRKSDFLACRLKQDSGYIKTLSSYFICLMTDINLIDHQVSGDMIVFGNKSDKWTKMIDNLNIDEFSIMIKTPEWMKPKRKYQFMV